MIYRLCHAEPFLVLRYARYRVLAAEGPQPGAASGTGGTRGSAPGALGVTKRCQQPVPAGCIRTLNEVQRRAAASLSPALSPQVLLL